ncbi:MAG: DsrE family protein [Nitrospirae bacterium]|nr:DsrE family protein [Nitrospirota bacterium]
MGELAGKKLGILMATHPERGDLARVGALADAALEQGADCYLYLIDEGTRAYGDPALKALQGRGLKLFVCAYGGLQRGVQPDEGAVFGGLSVLGGILEGCDRFVSFG